MSKARAKADWTWGGFFWKLLLGIGIAVCFAWSQWCGWAVTGTMLADTGVKRTVASTATDTAAETLARKKAERAALTLPTGETKAGLQEKLKLEQTRTSGKYKDGNGPAATTLKDKIALFERDEELEAEIASALKTLNSAPTVAGGDVDVAIPVGLAQRFGWIAEDVKPELVAANVRFWFIVFIVGAMGFFATFGFRLVGVRHDEIGIDLLWDKPIVWVPLIILAVEAGMNSVFGYARAGGGWFNLPGAFQALMFAGVAVLGAFLPTQWDRADAPLVDKKTQAFIDSFDVGARRLGAGGAQQLHDELVERFGRDAVDKLMIDPQVAALHGKLEEAGLFRTPPAPQEMPRPVLPPINGFPPPSQPPRLDQYGAGGIHVHVGAPAVGQPHTPPQDAPSVRPAQPAAGPPPAPLALPPPVQTGAPVDRSGVMKHTDHLLLFKQACLEPMPSALVSADDMYARYVAWAGPRRLSQAAFLALLSELADVPQSHAAGGHLHFYDFAIRTTQPRAASA